MRAAATPAVGRLGALAIVGLALAPAWLGTWPAGSPAAATIRHPVQVPAGLGRLLIAPQPVSPGSKPLSR